MNNGTILGVMTAMIVVLWFIISNTERSYLKRNIMRVGSRVITFFRFWRNFSWNNKVFNPYL